MDSSRGSSSYSTDSSTKKPTLLNDRPILQPNGRANSFKAMREYAESLASASSRTAVPTSLPVTAPMSRAPSTATTATTAPAPVSRTPSTSVSSSMATSESPSASATPTVPPRTPTSATSRSSSKPSFMNYRDEREPKSPQIAIPERSTARKAVPTYTPTAPAPPKVQGVLVLAAVAQLHPRTMYYLGILLKKQSYAGIMIVGSQAQEVAIKELKMEVYGLIGQLQQEMVVSTHTLDDWNEESLTAMMRKAKGDDETAYSVLCTPAFELSTSSTSDLLSMDRAEMYDSWSRSVGFLHALAKASLPSVLEGQRGSRGNHFFLVMATPVTSPSALLNQTTCDALIAQLREAHSRRDLTVGRAEEILTAEPEPVRANGTSSTEHEPYDESIFTPGESPTKLWGMWSMQNEIGG